MKSPHSEFLGWDHYAGEYARRLEAANSAGHPEWVELPASRRDAKGAGKYFTGRPCKQGHVTPRYATIRGYPSVSCLIIDECAFLQGEGGGEDLIAGVLPMLTEKGQVYFSSTPAGKNNYFARLFLDAKPGDGVHRIVVKGTDIPRLKDKVERMRRTLSATKFRQEIECELLSDGTSYFDLSIIENATSTEGAICPKM